MAEPLNKMKRLRSPGVLDSAKLLLDGLQVRVPPTDKQKTLNPSAGMGIPFAIADHTQRR